jgi:DNA-binding MarR family transcriptional regulator
LIKSRRSAKTKTAQSGKTYWVVDKRQLMAMTSPRRHEMCDALAAQGPMSIRELANVIGVQPSSLYHHINRLLAVGLIVEAGSRVARRRREQLYATPAPRMRLARALSENKYPDVIAEIVSALTRQIARDFRTGARLPDRIAEGEERNLGFFRLIGRPSPAQLARINACFAEISEIMWNSVGNSEGVIGIGWVMAPLEDARERD